MPRWRLTRFDLSLRQKKPFRLSIRGCEFSGYDDDTGKPYSGSVESGLVSIYDSEVRKSFDYSV